MTTSLYTLLDGELWVSAPPTSIRQYPRTPVTAVRHGLEYLDNTEIVPHSWAGRGMTAVARAYGLQSAETERIPRTVRGAQFSGIRQYRWLRQTYPDWTVPAPNSRTFGTNVPKGAILYWDEEGTGLSGVGIACGYENGILQQLCATTDVPKYWDLRDVRPFGCVGWSAPIFFAPSTMTCRNLWED